MRVLVTGAAGFIGQAVVRHLASAGHEVRALVHRTRADVPSGVQVCRGDLTDGASLDVAVANVEAVCHLAGVTRVRDSFTDPLRYYQVNVAGTVALLAALDRADRRARLVFASTGAVYGSAAAQPISEEQPPHPENPYAGSKHAAEEAIRWQAATGRLGAVTLRAFNVAGAIDGLGDRDLTRLIPKLVAVSAGREQAVEINGTGRAERGFLHVADFASATEAALLACSPGQYRVYNVSGTRASVAEVVRTAREVCGKDIAVRHRPAGPEPAVVVGDNRRIQTELGWQPQRSQLKQIIHDAWTAERAAPAIGQMPGNKGVHKE
ncbi:NAD-dependent epimerase/dehydratase family protein [Streptomyces noursei]|uniref:NAD-dependent epimerase/dehydratase family protein n=1 Tax=Streptomyces noursei TaxID=1971 RepID=UPI00081C3C07|nr:UDP-glucose 4-epimerase [Streptomyces noursei ATCC 11455]MCZ0992653.1 NAD-dependent epimerase/dehydratase family protein [Streptomyces noursei]